MATRPLFSFCRAILNGKPLTIPAIRPKCIINPQSHRVVWPTFRYCTTGSQKIVEECTVTYQNGLPCVSVPLPSRLEKCQFLLKPVGNTVDDFIGFMKDEDKGIDRAAIYAEDGTRIAKATPIELLMQNKFRIVINDRTFEVSPPEIERCTHEHLHELGDIKTLVAQLYSTLQVEEHQLHKEKEILARLESYKVELEPLEKVKDAIMKQSNSKTNTLAWAGLGLMGLQFGFLARLTWWEYSWDIMEPVTYFVTYGTSMAMYAYFVLTRQEYIFPDVKDREFLISFHKKAKKVNLDVEKYNRLRYNISQAELDLKRLRDPLQLQLPLPQLQKHETSGDYKN